MASNDTEKLLIVKDLHKSFGDEKVLGGINQQLEQQDVVTLLGRSGSGKSTYLRCIQLLEKFDQGEIILDGENLGYREEGGSRKRFSGNKLAKQRSQIGMVFQHFALFSHMTALENIIQGPIHVQGKSKKEAIQRAKELLDEVGLLDQKDSYPSELSGGQRQRVGIARALATDPKLMLFDEPTSALDPELVHGVLQLMKKIAEEGMTMVVVTHEINFAKEVSTRVSILHKGKIIEEGRPKKIFSSPDHEVTQDFLSAIL